MKDAAQSGARQTLAAFSAAVLALKLSCVSHRGTQPPVRCLMWVSPQRLHARAGMHAAAPHAHQLHAAPHSDKLHV